MKTIALLLQNPVLQALGWALVHFIWQGAAVALLFSVASALSRKRSARFRYALASLSLLLLLLLPLVTFTALFSLSAGTAVRLRSLDMVPQKTAVAADRDLTGMPDLLVSSTGSGPAAAYLSGPRTEVDAPTQPHLSLSAWAGNKLSLLMPWLIAGWLLGVAGLSIRLVGGIASARRLQRERNHPVARVWQLKLRVLCDRVKVSRPVLLCESVLVEVPTVVGWLRPVILVPASALAELAAEQLEALLAHELAHIRRYDYLINLMQTAVETLLFYHPAVWWISGQMRVERENCCDDIAVSACGDTLVYARALADLEHLRGSSTPFAVAATGGSLLARIERLVGRSRPGRHQVAPQLAGLSAVAVALVPLLFASGVIPPPSAIGAVGNRLAASPVTRQIARAFMPQSKPTPATASGPGGSPAADGSKAGEIVPPTAQVRSLDDTGMVNDADEDNDHDVDDTSEVGDQEKSSGAAQPSGDYIDQMAAVGYKNLTVEQLITLKEHGVTPDYVKALRDAGYDRLAVRELIAMKDHGLAPEYLREMAGAGYSGLPAREIIGMRNAGVSPDYVSALKAAGYSALPVRTIIALKQQNVSPEYIKEMRDAGFDKLTPQELVGLRSQGVSPQDIKEMRDAGFDKLTAHELAAMHNQGVNPQYIKEMRAAGLEAVTPRELLGLKQQGVDAQYVKEMKDAGLDKLSAHQLIALRTQGVTADYFKQMKGLGLDELPVLNIIAMKQQGVDPEYIKQMRELVSKDLSARALISMRIQGVDAEFVNGMKRAGYDKLSAQELIGFKVQGVDPEYVHQMRDLVSKDLSARELISMRIQGVDAEFISGMKRAGYDKLSPEQLISMKVQGVDPGYVAAMKSAGYPGLSVREIVELKISGVTPEFVKQMKDRGFKDLTVRQLIALKRANLSEMTTTEPEPISRVRTSGSTRVAMARRYSRAFRVSSSYRIED
jgi:beta-lactamase regulating signal transducer with metallopeptidase domain